MYQFTTTEIAGLSISKTIALQGTDHKKRYTRHGVTPASQNTLNVYASGDFEVEVGGASYQMAAGQTSLDLPVTEYPAGEVCIERVLSQWGCRFCVSSSSPWSRQKFTINGSAQFTPTKDCLLVLLSGELSTETGLMRPVSYRLARAGVAIDAVVSSTVIVCRVDS